MRLLRYLTLFIVVALLAMGLSRSASADLIADTATSTGNFGTLDLNTGQFTFRGSSNLP